MSCQLNVVACLQDLGVLYKFFFPKENLESVPSQDDWKDDNWGWGEDKTEDESDSPCPENSDWLQQCKVSISALGDLIAIGFRDRLAVLQAEYSGGDGSELAIVWKGSVSEFPGETVTAVYCLPLASYKQTSAEPADWTSIIVGFSSGHLRIYNETGTKVLDQMIHNEPITSIKCRTYTPARYSGTSDLHEELSILYETVIVTLDGFGLYQSLRACKSQTALALAKGSKMPDFPALAYRKWNLKNQGSSDDHASLGSYTPNLFDQMQAASLTGFGERISNVPPTSQLYVATGDNPYLGVYHAFEGESHQLLSNLTGAATKLLSVGASALRSWGSSFLSRSTTPTTQEAEKQHQQKIEPASPAWPRYSLHDKGRLGNSIALSPFGCLAAVTDSLGRVLLIDTSRGIVQRVWKGYRNAQVGWLTVKESSRNRHDTGSSPRHALFLVIYAPKRGLLEIWLSVNGPRVGAFNVGKTCRLLYPGATLLGLNSANYRLVKGRTHSVLLLTSEGEITEIGVPFHLALSDASSKRAHDQQLLKVIKSSLRETSINLDDLNVLLWDNIKRLKLPSSQQYILEKILNSEKTNPDTAVFLILNLINNIKKLLPKRDSEVSLSSLRVKTEPSNPLEGLPVEVALLRDFCESRLKLINLYLQLNDLELANEPDVKYAETDDDASVPSVILPVDDVSSTLALPSLHTPREPRRVVFQQEARVGSLASFLNLFTFPHGQHRIAALRRDLDVSAMELLGELLLGKALTGDTLNWGSIKQNLAQLNIRPTIMQEILLHYYLSLDSPNKMTLERLHQLLYHLYKLAMDTPEHEPPTPSSPSEFAPSTPEVREIAQDPPQTPTQAQASWWKHSREVLVCSVKVLHAMHVALCCRSVVVHLQQAENLQENEIEETAKEEAEQSSESDGQTDQSADESKPDTETIVFGWENLSESLVMWNLCIQQLHDVSVVNHLLGLSVRVITAGGPNCLKPTSVRQIKASHRGAVAEIMGRWCFLNKLSVDDLNGLVTKISDTDRSSQSSIPQNADLMQAYHDVLAAFPNSVTSDTIYANACWEFISCWNRDREKLAHFRMGVEYLNKISNACLKHGICCMVWRTYLCNQVGSNLERPLTSLVMLIEKVRKAPKDRLCVKETGMSLAPCTEFLQFCVEFMNIFAQANCDFTEPIRYSGELAWETGSSGGQSLVDMACQNRETNYRLLMHHYSVLLAACAVLTFQMKSVRIMSLYGPTGYDALWKDLTSHPYLAADDKDQIVSSSRKSFLSKVVFDSVASLPVRDPTQHSNTVTYDQASEGLMWQSKVEELAEFFKLDIDVYRKQWVLDLLSFGHDALALQMVGKVQEQKSLCHSMFDVCTLRFAHFLFTCDDESTAKITSQMSASLLDVVNSSDYSKLAVPGVPIQETNKLLLQVVRGLSNDPLLMHADQLYSITNDLK